MTPTVEQLDPVDRIAELSSREREMVYLMGQGYSTQEIAVLWSRATKTATTHRINAARKLGFRGRVELRLAAFGGRHQDILGQAKARRIEGIAKSERYFKDTLRAVRKERAA